MDCKTVLKNIVAYLDGELDKDLSARIGRHLESCPACNKEARLLFKAWNLLDEFPELAPREKIIRGVKERLKGIDREKKVLLPVNWGWQKIAGLATAAVLIIVFGVCLVTDVFQPAEPPAQPDIKITGTEEAEELKVRLDYYAEFLNNLEEVDESYYDISVKEDSGKIPSFSFPEETF